jgi:hypothetical protein
MNHDDMTMALLALLEHETDLDLDEGADRDQWMLGELRYARYHAQAEADAAYETWRHNPGPHAYAVYRAASDRADAAQDALAEWARRHGGDDAEEPR